MKEYPLKIKLYAPCSECIEGSFRIDHIKLGDTVTWSCDKCGSELTIIRSGVDCVHITPTGYKKVPITITLQSTTIPVITVKLNTHKSPCYKNYTDVDFRDGLEYYYNEHTCPTNWVHEIEQIEFEGDTDPHGLFKFVSVENGHFKENNEF